MKEIIQLLRDLKLWTILGTLIAIATLYLTIVQHKDNEVTFRLVRAGNEYVEIKDGATVQCILLGFNNAPDRDSIRFEVPMVFENDMDNGIDISFEAVSPQVKFSPNPSYRFDGYSAEGKLLQHDIMKLPFDIYPDTEKLQAENFDEIDVKFFWSYEKMAHKGRCDVKFIVTSVDKDALDIKSDYKIILSPSKGNPRVYTPTAL